MSLESAHFLADYSPSRQCFHWQLDLDFQELHLPAEPYWRRKALAEAPQALDGIFQKYGLFKRTEPYET
jgi:hypothetical protein